MILLNKKTFAAGLKELSQRDPDFGRVLAKLGPPPMWTRRKGFGTLILIILEQQVSLASARAAFRRLTETVSPLTPEGFLKLSDSRLRRIGFSRQKTGYGRNLASAIIEGRIGLKRLERMDDETVRSELTQLKGIGKWTADIYLVTALRRPDIMPCGDLALASAVQMVKGLSSRPTPAELRTISEMWRPWRAVAARILWHYYLES